jgi:glucokinase
MTLPASATLPSPVSSPVQFAADRPIFGLDLGGTKCAASVLRDGCVEEVSRCATGEFEPTFAQLVAGLRPHVTVETPCFGVSCGGPLDAASGVILSPPNLPPSWHGVPIVARLTALFGGGAVLMNDANACALAEWRFGAGRGTRHMIFLTSGTGMGSGLILNGQLYEGATGDAGEIGHVRLRAEGPIGYGKAGSVEGFTSGGGIARLAESMIAARGETPAWAATGVPITTKQITGAAQSGDALAREVIRIAGERLGETLAIVIDLLNPERVVIGGFFPHCHGLLESHLQGVLECEALPGPRRTCEIVPAQLGDTIGSHGAIAAALHGPHPSGTPLDPIRLNLL